MLMNLDVCQNPLYIFDNLIDMYNVHTGCAELPLTEHVFMNPEVMVLWRLEIVLPGNTARNTAKF